MSTQEPELSSAGGASALTAGLGSLRWNEETMCDGSDTLYTARIEGVGRITVLERETGFSFMPRDVESGFNDNDGKFWLASGNCDVRRHEEFTVAQAIKWIKANANTCVAA